MKVRVLFFGATAAAAGTNTLELNLDDRSNTGQVYDDLLERFPELSRHRLLFAVNQEYASRSTPLNAGDELAVFTAVSGG
jgi:molybdopterin converting factor small subunit